MTEDRAQSGVTLRDYMNVAKRRKWIILLSVLVVPAAAIAFSLTQTKLYQATAEVLLSRQNLAAALTGTPDAAQSLQADRNAQTQASLARVPDVARRVINSVGAEMTPEQFLETSSVSTKLNADLLDFRVTNADPLLARRLASSYAREFADYRRELDTRALTRARLDLEETIRELSASGERRTELYRSLVASQQQLRTLEALQTSNAFPVRDAEDVEQVQPKPVRNAILGIVLGLVFGAALAFLWEALDTRVRTADDIGSRLHMPFLARLPQPPKKLQRQDQLVMVAEPADVHAEPFRMFRMNLEFVRLDRDVRTIMVTSAVEQEGKSTTVANLAVALARSGQNVVLVDLDLRRPYLDKFFGLVGLPGVTQVALGMASLTEALVPVAGRAVEPRRNGPVFPVAQPSNSHPAAANGGEPGSLRVLPAGAIPPDPGEFVGSQRLVDIFAELRETSDIVLVDAPPMLRVADAMTLSANVDAMIIVTRLNVVRRQMLQELHRLLESAPATKLGFVLTGAETGDDVGYGYGYGYGYSHGRSPAEERDELAEPA